jgi:hypothetical protein
MSRRFITTLEDDQYDALMKLSEDTSVPAAEFIRRGLEAIGIPPDRPRPPSEFSIGIRREPDPRWIGRRSGVRFLR